MARSRNIKPGLFLNEDLAELGIEAHFLFTGLPCIADKEGRLEDRPKRIKVQLMPYYNVDIDGLLTALGSGSDPFIIRYKVDGVPYIQIVNFDKHQTPHHKEEPSKLPPPNDFGSCLKHDSSMDQACVKQNASCPTDSFNLIPDSLNPKPDSLFPSNDETHTTDEAVQVLPCSEPTKEPAKRFTAPTVADVRSYCTERKNQVDPERFVDFYASKNWMVGKNKMVDWRASVRLWEKGETFGTPGRPPPPPKPAATAPVPARIPKVTYE